MVHKISGIIHAFLFVLIASLILTFPGLARDTQAAELTPKRGVATGTVMIQGYSFLSSEGRMTFYNVGGLLADSSYNDAYLTTDEPISTGAIVDLKGIFSGGPDGVASFVTAEGLNIDVPLQNGRTFYLSIPGAVIDLTVTDPSIFEPDETPVEAIPAEPEEQEEGKARDSGARVSDLSGQVEIACPPDLDAWDVMKMGRVIYVDCHLKTGEDSSAEISFGDMTTFKMKPESELVIDTPPEKESKISLIAGNIWVNVKQMIKDGTMKVHGSQAVAGIKGTTFVMEEREGVTSLKVIEGTVDFTSTSTGLSLNESIDVTGGQAVSSDGNGLGEVRAFDVEAERQSWEEKASAPGFPWYLIPAGLAIFGIIFLMFRKIRNYHKK